MKKVILTAVVLAFASSMALAKTTDMKQMMIKHMTTACKADLAKEPALKDFTDGEMIWKNLEDKEHAGVKLTKACNMAHEKYEHKFHKGEEAGEHETGEHHE